MSGDERYPPIGDYAPIGDGHSAALASGAALIDWCCLPRLDHGASLARLLDWHRGGFRSVHPLEEPGASRRYLDGTLVLETNFRSDSGQARVLDCLTINVDDPSVPFAQILRVVEGVTGRAELCATIAAQFDYGTVRPWRRHHGGRLFSLTGGDDGLVICGDIDSQLDGRHDLEASFSVRPGDRLRRSLSFTRRT
jgi:GH15 family glucan-1,4-alpha-glucosidase